MTKKDSKQDLKDFTNNKKMLLNHEERLLELESKLKYANRQLNRIENDIKKINENLDELANGGFTKLLQDQNDELIKTLATILKDEQELETYRKKAQEEKEILDKKMKLKIWHIIALILGSGAFSILMENFLKNL